MNLRDQLLKSGLANEQQARKAERQAQKTLHKKSVEARAKHSDSGLSEAERLRAADDEAQRLYIENSEKEQWQKQLHQYGLDIVARASLNDKKAKGLYYLKKADGQIESVAVNELQAMQLAAGQLAIAHLETDDSYRLLSEENTRKILQIFPHWIVCYHKKTS